MATLETNGFDGGVLLRTTANYPGNISYSNRIIDYAESGAWDPNSRKFLFMSATQYNPVHKIMLFGGGNDGGGKYRDLYKMDVNGVITKLKNSPMNTWITAGKSSDNGTFGKC